MKQKEMNAMTLGIMFGALAIGILVILTYSYYPENTVPYEKGFQDGKANCTNETINTDNFRQTLETIQSNCGSVFFVSYHDYNIFTQECKGEYCKTGVYKTIEECLK